MDMIAYRRVHPTKMNVDDKNIEPSTNLSLALGYSNQCIQRNLSNDPGAGANAASTADITFVATDPLSELVWSPHKGLSLRCADGSFIDKKPSLLPGVGPTYMASGSSSDKPISNTGKLFDNEICIASLPACKLASEISGDNSTTFLTSNVGIMPLSGTGLDKTATGDQVVEMKNAVNYFLQKEDLRNDKAEDETKLDVAQNYRTFEEPIVRATDVNDDHELGMEIVLVSDFHTVKGREDYGIKIQNAACSGKENEEPPSVREKDRENKMVIGRPGIFSLDKLESTAENDLETPFGENSCSMRNKNLASESADRVENNTQHELIPIEYALGYNQSPTSSRLQNIQRQGESKALSDGDAKERMLNEEDGSHESVESCNSTELFSTGKQRWNFDQQLMVGSKRVKRQIQDSPGSSSLGKQDSSFVNWISNMMKGFLKSSEGEAPFLSSALSNPNHGHENPSQDVFTCNRKEDPACDTRGFQSVFQSLYCRKTKGQETVTLNVNHQTEGSKECDQDNKICDLNAAPIACRMVSGNVYKRFLPSNEKHNEPTSGYHAGMTVHSRDISMSFPVIPESNGSVSTENKNSCNLAIGKEKDGTDSNFSHGKHKTSSAGKIDPELPSKNKTAHGFGYKGDPLGSLWIARFSPKTSGAPFNHYPSNKSTGEAFNCSADSMGLIPQVQNPLGSSSEHEIVEVRNKNFQEPLPIQNYSTANRAPFDFYNVKGNIDNDSGNKLNPILSSARVKTSEAMASVSPRRLDAPKYITPSDDADNSDRASMTCFFCGIKGHDLRECSEVTDTELEDLLRNINIYGGIKELPCVCIRCFQLNHWAVACPSTCPRVRSKAECHASSVSHAGPSKSQLHVINEDDTKAKNVTGSGHAICYGNDYGMDKDMNSWKSNEAATSGKMKLNIRLFEKNISSTSREKELKENQIIPLYGFVNGLISDVPNGIFDAVRSLRLTRTNILKWMNSSASLSIDGYFVRLRLGKWEEGLGGTGYYVARITGGQIESSSKKSKKSIAVNVGGIQCVIESQFVSNHDFLEDELKAWWSATSKVGGKLPSEKELRLKVEEKNTLGL
ncbi:uncharacterized protein LOC8280168 isoform X2 [Ricinus communis]|uniref:uncharacterized protein LOC8280168 isoform X2 n=2 Tax=Ricinus communis TaxID=3988 RepID=UPI00201B0B87|nr:uncharacterized protein LOC8280168 isoform X2 [Ricinus communis]